MLNARRWSIGAAALVAALAAGAAGAGVPEGIAAWQAGDYPTAVREWRPLAEQGDADAQFNLGQAYRLGRGVPQDLNLAGQWYERAARQRHEQAGTNLGLMLFQNGRAREAMPWIQAAALRGDPRAQYVFGTALFNGDIVQRDVARAWAMMSSAADQGFPQAVEQLRAMESHVSPEERQRAEAMARELGAGRPQVAENAAPRPLPREPQQRPPRTVDQPGRTPVRTVETRPQPRTEPRPVRTEPRDERPPQRAEAPRGRYRVQLGAFSSDANARRQWAEVRGIAAMRGLQPFYARAGGLIRLQAGPLASRTAAERACASVRAAGEVCILVNP